MKYSLYDFLVEYQNNEADLQAYLHGKTIENYNGSGSGDKYFGLEIGVFIAIFLIAIVIWIWAIVVLIKYWKMLPDWAKVVGLLGVLPIVPLGPIVTLIVVYIGKQW